MPSRVATGLSAFWLLAAPMVLAAQTAAVPPQLTLAQALDLARRNSPTYRQSLNDEDPAAMAVKASYGSLLPTVNASTGMSYSRAGRQTFANQVFSQGAANLGSSYSISVGWSVSPSSLLGPGQSKAQQRVTEASIAASGVNLVADVTAQYLTVLRATASLDVARQQVARNQEFLDLARARFNVGATSVLDVRQAEVTKSGGDVGLLRSEQAETDSKIELLRRMGLPAAQATSLRLTETFALSAPTWTLEQLTQTARGGNPTLQAAEAQQEAATIGARAASRAWLPSFSVSTGLSGFTQQATSTDPALAGALASAKSQAANCQFQNDILSRLTSPHPSPNGGIIADCNAYSGLDATGGALQPAIADQIRANNDRWPFNFTRQPWSISFGLSMPLWDGFSRASRSSAARAAEDDAREAARARQLEVDGQIQSRLLAVQTAWRAAGIFDTNRVAAREQLRLAQDKYRIGNGTALEVADAQNAVTRAEVDYVTAVYDYHLAVVALEAAVGRPLR